jgi:AraC family transcriptional regulator
MNPFFALLAPKKLVGQRVQMSWTDDQTSPLWRGFRARRAEVPNRIDANSISVQRYGRAIANGELGPTTFFEKWAAVEVTDFTDVPADMETHELAGGLYAVFTHHGPAHEYARTAQQMFGEWLPTSGYRLDPDRDHFEVFTDAYHPLDPAAEEEIWLPIVQA